MNDEIEEKLNQIINLLDGEEINDLPDSIMATLGAFPMRIHINAAITYGFQYQTYHTDDGSTQLLIKIKGPYGDVVFYRRFTFVLRDPFTGRAYDKRGQYKNPHE